MGKPPRRRPTWHVVVGLLLVLPALVMLLIDDVWPTLWTVRTSFQRVSLRTALDGDKKLGGDYVGLDNYHGAFDVGVGGSFLYALSLAVVPLLLVLVLAPVLAWTAHLGGRFTRWVVRVLLALPLAAYAPVAVLIARRNEILLGEDTHYSLTTAPRTVYWWATFGLVTAVAVVAYLGAFRSSSRPLRAWLAALVAGGVLTAGVLAATMQEFTSSYLFGSHDTLTPTGLAYAQFGLYFDWGAAAAIATLELVALLLLGLAVTILLVVTGARIDVVGFRETPRVRVVGALVGVVLGVVVLAFAVNGLRPWLGHITEHGRATTATAVNTWVPSLLTAVVGVTVAGLAAYGISGFRPLGRYSELLLIPFGLFLFVGSAPFTLHAFAGRIDQRSASFLDLIPPNRLAIPALLVLALLFRGLTLRRDAAATPSPWWRGVLLPALPMVALAYLVTWVLHAQAAYWPWVSSREKFTGPTLLLGSVSRQIPRDALPYDRVLPIWVLIPLVLVAIAASLLYLDRLALRLGRPTTPDNPR